ncbi:Son of sevenless 1 [Ranunculus cassubicifolius]
MVLLAGPGVLLSTFFLGSCLKLFFPYDWSWKMSLLLGGLLSATDPVAVVALLKELGASKKISTIIEGESLMNDGTAIVVYQLFYQMVLGRSFTFGAIVKFLTQVSLGAVGIGLAFGIISFLWLGFIFNDTVIEITLTLAVSYLSYFAAQDGADVSGVLTVMTLGMFYSAVARTAFKGDGQQSLHHFWEMVTYIANTLIFILSGVVIAEGVLHNKTYFESHGTSWAYLILLYALVQASRIIVVGTLYPFLAYFGYGLDWKEATILVWSGLRGAVALSLSLSVKRTSDSSTFISRDTGTLFVFFTGGIVFLTLILNGSTTQFVLHYLGMDKLSESKKRILDYTGYEMMNKALDAFGDLGDDEELGPSDWATVKKYITCLNSLEGEQVHPHDIPENEDNLEAMHLKDIRIRLLNGVQAAYWGMLEEGRISQHTANIMMQSVDQAMDLVSHEALCDWNGLKDYVNFPNYYKFLQMRSVPQKLVTYFTVERLEAACYICAAFLRAHRNARRQLHDFLGASEIASVVINESESEGEPAKKFLEDVRVMFPQVLRVVKTRQVTYSILIHLSEYLKNLEKVGILEQKEMHHLHDVVQTDLKRLLRNPPLVKMPKIKDLMKGHPLLGSLPTVIREPLEESTKESMKLHGVTLYREGSKPQGIWLISSGVVKWTSRNLRNKHALHPTFSHGSSLGLYEVLVGKSHICSMITDSVVHCFFIESEKILSMLSSDPKIEDLLWQESVIVVAKLLLPQVFEKKSLQELRVLVLEKSVMNIYLRGETIEIPDYSVGFLLEGFIKSQDKDVQEEFISSPAVLFSPHGLNLETAGAKAASFCHQGSGYLVETRARVIFFDMAAVETETAYPKRTASWISHSVDLPRIPSKEHTALMSWPELHIARNNNNHQGNDHRHTNSLSARAMQLGMFGTMVNESSVTRSVPRSFRVKKPHSRSYPRVPSKKKIPLPRTRTSTELEGNDAVEQRVRAEKISRSKTFNIPVPHLSEAGSSRGHVEVEISSSDESGDDSGLVVRIDSPSRLSFHQSS